MVRGLILDLSTFDRDISEQFANQLNRRLRLALPKIERGVRSIVKKRIEESSEWNRLKTSLAGVYGLPAGEEEARFSAILSKLLETTITIKQKPTPKSRSGVKMELLIESGGLESMADTTEMREAVVFSSKGNEFKWWSFIVGSERNSTIIQWGPEKATAVEIRESFSRSEKIIMRKGAGRRFRNPPEFQGPHSFIYTLLNQKSVLEEIAKILQKEIGS